MATLATPPLQGGISRIPAGAVREERQSSFTAVNGSFIRGPPSESHVMGDTITVHSEKQPTSQSHEQSRPTPPPSRQENVYLDYRNMPTEQQQLPSPTETSVNSTKRKRSVSEEEPSPLLPPAHRPSIKHVHQHSYDEHQYRPLSSHRIREIHSDGEQDMNDERLRQQSGDTRDNSSSPAGSGRRDHYLSSQRQFAEPLSSESDRPNRGFPQSNMSGQWDQSAQYSTGYQDDARERDPDSAARPDSAPRQGGDPQESSLGGWAFPSGQQDIGDGEESYAEGTPTQVGPKRKRNFSNRTKTGCMTCRKRKKKCDEAHPYCQNCSRGGFACEGYSNRASWPKANNPKTPVPLQSKDDQDATFTGERPSPRPGQHHLPGISTGNPFPPRPVHQESHDPSRGYTAPSPASASSAVQPQHSQNWPSNTQAQPYNAERRNEFRDLPPLHNPNRGEAPREFPGVPPISEMARVPPGHAPQQPSGGPWTGQSPADTRNAYMPPAAAAPPPPAHTIDNRANVRHHPPSHHDHKPPQPPMTLISERAEKDKMILGHLYKFMDNRLQDERGRCREALWRLNNAGNPQFGISEAEKIRLLKDVLRPTRHLPSENYPGPAPQERATGSLGSNAHIELPFKCHYGYNIHIGEDAYIGENCTIIDACKVTIGAKTWIGANVTILTAMAHTDLQHRQGANSSWQGKEVVIEEDVYIGANVMIYPGVRLARGAFIEPGSIVKQDQPQYGYLGYKPMYLSQSTPPGV